MNSVNPSQRYVPPALVTRADLQDRVDAGRAEQNMHGYTDLVRWIEQSKQYREKPAIRTWARRLNKDPRTVKRWVAVYEADA